jgi:uncharacterized membrane protein
MGWTARLIAASVLAVLSIGYVATHAQAQGAPTPTSLQGVYGGDVKRTNMITRKSSETRRYTVTFDPDGRSGKLVINGTGVNYEMVFVGDMKDTRTYVGKTKPTVASTSTNYKPDNITMEFSADGRSLKWHHEDGTMEGAGTFRRR